MKKIVPFLVMCISAAPVYAQDSGANPQSNEAAPPSDTLTPEVNSKPVCPCKPKESETDKLEFDWKLSFAPTIGGNFPMERGDSLSDYQTTGLEIGMTAPIPEMRAKLTASGSIRSNFDGDQDAGLEHGSSISGSLQLRRDDKAARFSPFVQYVAETSFSDFLENYAHTDHRVAIGTGYKAYKGDQTAADHTGFKVSGVDIDVLVERVFSTQDSRERTTPKAIARFTGQFVRGVNWEIKLETEARFFERHGEAKRQVDIRSTVFAGIDFAKRIDPTGKFLQEMKVGVRYIETASNKNSDSSTTHLLPVITVGRKF